MRFPLFLQAANNLPGALLVVLRLELLCSQQHASHSRAGAAITCWLFRPSLPLFFAFKTRRITSKQFCKFALFKDQGKWIVLNGILCCNKN